jgi:hypothetical protein
VRDKLAVTSEVKLQAGAPAGSRFRGYEDVLVQDLKISVEVVRYAALFRTIATTLRTAPT